MNRREFVTQSCLACIGTGTFATMVTGCASTRYVNGTLEANGLTIPKSEFTYLKKDKPVYRQFIVISNDKLEFPIYVFRISDQEYSALWMKCTHQGSELHASGDHLYCPSHGSEFDKKGNVAHGPAEKNLRSFPVADRGETLFIDMT
jgi:Rieske Fe-S protein